MWGTFGSRGHLKVLGRPVGIGRELCKITSPVHNAATGHDAGKFFAILTFQCLHVDLCGGSSATRNPRKGQPSHSLFYQILLQNTSCTLCGLSDCAIMAEALGGSSATLLLLEAGPHGLVAPCAWPLAAADGMVRGSARSETARCSLWRHGARRDGGIASVRAAPKGSQLAAAAREHCGACGLRQQIPADHLAGGANGQWFAEAAAMVCVGACCACDVEPG